MDTQSEQIRDQQKATWNKFSPGWRKWDELTMDFLQPMGKEIIRLLNPKDGDLILDVASGTGEPGLTIAGMIGSGKVIATDISDGMLKVAMEKAQKNGVKNFETQVADVCELPFKDNTFDAISCRFGFMFFPDMFLAAKEMARVIKPGGKIVTSVWNGPEKNFWVTVTMGSISKNLQLTPPAQGAPGMFRCAQSGLIADLFRKAGLKNVTESEITSRLNCKTADNYWNMMTEVAAPVVSALSNADETTMGKIKSEVFQSLHQKYSENNVLIDSSALIIYGEK